MVSLQQSFKRKQGQTDTIKTIFTKQQHRPVTTTTGARLESSFLPVCSSDDLRIMLTCTSCSLKNSNSLITYSLTTLTYFMWSKNGGFQVNLHEVCCTKIFQNLFCPHGKKETMTFWLINNHRIHVFGSTAALSSILWFKEKFKS